MDETDFWTDEPRQDEITYLDCEVCNMSYKADRMTKNTPYICKECYQSGAAAKRLADATRLLMDIQQLNDYMPEYNRQRLYDKNSTLGRRIRFFINS